MGLELAWSKSTTEAHRNDSENLNQLPQGEQINSVAAESESFWRTYFPLM